jgi:glutathione gamma-glutamylcysteinyltransferase
MAAVAATRRCATCVSRMTCTMMPRAASSCAPPENSVFKRTLPDSLIGFSSAEGRRRLAEAQRSGHADAFFPLIEQFVTQDEPTYCGARAETPPRPPRRRPLAPRRRPLPTPRFLSPGVSSLTMVMNALNVDPRRRWRDESGPGWRWWSDEMMVAGACAPSLSSVKADGVCMDVLARMAAASGARVSVRRPAAEGTSLDAFRATVVGAASAASEFLVLNYCRATLGQTGGGHFSPIAAYHAPSDSALVLDVARFKYPPYFVPLPLLYESMRAADAATGRPRGYLKVGAAALPAAASAASEGSGVDVVA